MKNYIRQILAMILWVIAGAIAYAQQYSFEISVSPSSQKTTSYVWGTKFAPHVAYDIANKSSSSVTISRLWFEKSWTVSDVFIEDGERLVKATNIDDYNGSVGVSLEITIPAQTVRTIFVRGSIIDKPYYDDVGTTQISYRGFDIRGNYNGASYSYPSELRRSHAVIVEQSAIPSIKNSSGLQRLEGVKAYGFSIAGDRFMQSRVMIRVAGPALASLGVKDTVINPVLRVVDSKGAVVADSDDWVSSLSPRFAEVGAFAFIPGSRDAALELELPPGTYTVEVRNLDGPQVGTYLIETYQMTASSTNPRIVTPPWVGVVNYKG